MVIAKQLLSSMTARGVEFAVMGDRLRFRPAERVTVEETALLAQHKPVVIRLLQYGAPEEGVTVEANEFYWANLLAVDHAYLTAPRTSPGACAWCGGRLRHNPRCEEPSASWEPVLEFGQYKGRKVSDVPDRYLRWVADRSSGVPNEVRGAIRERLSRSGQMLAH